MSRISGYTYSGTPNDQLKYVSTKVVASGATALVCSLEDLNVTLSAGEINVSSFKNAAGTPKDAVVNSSDVVYMQVSNADYTAIANPIAGNTVGPTTVALPVADANTLAAVAVPTTPVGGSLIVTTSGSALQIAAGVSLPCKSLYVRARSGNVGNVYMGDSSVDVVTSRQIILAANDSVTLDISDRNKFWFDIDPAGNGVDGIDYLALS